MTNMHMKRYSILLVNMELYMKTITSHPFEILKLKSLTLIANYSKNMEKLEVLICCCVSYKIIQPFGDTDHDIFIKLNIHLSYDHAVSE